MILQMSLSAPFLNIMLRTYLTSFDTASKTLTAALATLASLNIICYLIVHVLLRRLTLLHITDDKTSLLSQQPCGYKIQMFI